MLCLKLKQTSSSNVIEKRPSDCTHYKTCYDPVSTKVQTKGSRSCSKIATLTSVCPVDRTTLQKNIMHNDDCNPVHIELNIDIFKIRSGCSRSQVHVGIFIPDASNVQDWSRATGTLLGRLNIKIHNIYKALQTPPGHVCFPQNYYLVFLGQIS